MELLLNEQQAQLADTAVRLARDVGGAPRSRALRDAKVEMDADAWGRIVEAGWLGVTAAETHDGLGLGLFDAGLAIEEAGKRLLMVPLSEATAATWTMSRAGVGGAALDALKAHLAAYWLIVPACEPAHWRFGGEAPVSGVRLDARAMTLSGDIAFVPFSLSANFFLVAASAGREPVLALVDGNSEGLSRKIEKNVDGSTSAELTLKGVAVAPDYVIAQGDAALKLANEMADLLSLLTSVELLGLANAAHEMTTDYLKLRQQFGKPIGSFQALQHRAVNGMIDIELNRSLIYRVLADFDRGAHHPAMVPAVKARAARVALEVTRNALQMHGAIGYTDSADIGLYYKRAIVLAARYGGELNHIARFSELTHV